MKPRRPHPSFAEALRQRLSGRNRVPAARRGRAQFDLRKRLGIVAGVLGLCSVALLVRAVDYDNERLNGRLILRIADQVQLRRAPRRPGGIRRWRLVLGWRQAASGPAAPKTSSSCEAIFTTSVAPPPSSSPSELPTTIIDRPNAAVIT